jgi:hypothetical protein
VKLAVVFDVGASTTTQAGTLTAFANATMAGVLRRIVACGLVNSSNAAAAPRVYIVALTNVATGVRTTYTRTSAINSAAQPACAAARRLADPLPATGGVNGRALQGGARGIAVEFEADVTLRAGVSLTNVTAAAQTAVTTAAGSTVVAALAQTGVSVSSVSAAVAPATVGTPADAAAPAGTSPAPAADVVAPAVAVPSAVILLIVAVVYWLRQRRTPMSSNATQVARGSVAFIGENPLMAATSRSSGASASSSEGAEEASAREAADERSALQTGV